MKKNRIFHHSYIANLLLIVVLFVSGCTRIYNQPLHQIDLSPINEKFNLPVGLIITNEYRNAKWEKKTWDDTQILPMGENLVHHTEQLIKRVFTQSVILDESENFQQNTEVKYFMKPKVVSVEQSFGVAAFSKAKTSVCVEWNLSDISGKTVWVETVRGVGLGKSGNIYNYKGHTRKRFKMALQDLFERTQKAMLSSRLLRNLK